MDYQSNSNKSREPKPDPEPKKVEKVVTGEVVIKKRSLGRKFKDLFINADAKSVALYVASDVLLPAARNMIVDASTKGIERMMYGESAARRQSYGGGTRITYNSPVNRGGPPRPSALPARRTVSPSRHTQEDILLSSREEAEVVLERMQDIINTYEVVSVADLNDLVGFPTTHTDNKWGWEVLGNAQIRQTREGYLIDFPPAMPI